MIYYRQVREDASPGQLIYKIAAEDPDVTSELGLRSVPELQ